MLYKVTGAGHSVCVCVCVWVGVVCGWWCGVWGAGGSEFSGAWCKRGEGGQDGREFSFLTAWWMKLSFSLWSWPGDSAVSSLMVAD